jgi:antitoxin MazE
MAKTANLTIQQWGNSLAVRIPAGVARAARFSVGQPVEVALDDSGITIRPVGQPKLSLAQKLALFDPAIHAGEAM